MLALVISLCLTGASAQSTDLVQRLEHIAILIRDNKIVEAERQLSPILKLAPNPTALNLLGTIRAKQGKLNVAESLFLRAISRESNFVGARMNLAHLYLLKRRPDKAISELKEVIRLEPNSADANHKLAELLLLQGHVDEGVELIEKMKLSQSASPTLLVMLGDGYLMKRDLSRAEEAYLMALDRRLENAGGLLGLAQISQARGEVREAGLYLSRVASLASESPDFLYKFALIALKSGMNDEAKSALERAIKLKPEELSYLLALGVAWLRKADLVEAEKVFRRLLALQPNNSQGQLHLGYILLNQKKYAEAKLWLEKSARSNAPVPEVFYYLGLVAQEQNDDMRAVELFGRAISQLPSYSYVRTALGVSHLRLKNYTRAREELEMSVKLNPDEPEAHYNLALLYSRLKDPQRAQEEMRIVETLKTKARTSSGGVVVIPAVPRPD